MAIKRIYEGLPDQGKSLVTAWQTYELLERNKNWWESGIVKKPRPVATEMELSPWIIDRFGLWPQGYVLYYKIKQLPELRQCDVIIDDMGTRFSAQRWQETPDAVRNWFRLMGHYECDVYGNAQDFLDVDISIRRKTQEVISLSKLIGSPRPGETYPPIKRPWGIIMQHRVHYSEMDKEQFKRKESKLGWPIFITKKKCSIYNTLQILEKSELPPYECYERSCTNPNHKDAYGNPFKHYYHAK